MRIGEALKLTIADLDLQQRTALIAHTKFGRQRIVMLDTTACQGITKYLFLPVRKRPGPAPERPIFVHPHGESSA